jgi:hypothetical protein
MLNEPPRKNEHGFAEMMLRPRRALLVFICFVFETAGHRQPITAVAPGGRPLSFFSAVENE